MTTLFSVLDLLIALAFVFLLYVGIPQLVGEIRSRHPDRVQTGLVVLVLLYLVYRLAVGPAAALAKLVAG